MTIRKESPSNQRRIIVSTIAQVASQIFIALIGIVILKIMTSSLGLKNYGVYATILAFVSTFSLLTDLGLNAITAREIAKDPNSADDIIGYNMGLRIFMCVIMIPVIFGLSFVFYKQTSSVLHIGILLLSLYLFFDAARSVAMAYFASKVKNEITAIVNGAQQVILFTLVILTAIMNWKIYGFILAFLVSNIVATVITIHLARKEVRVHPKVNIKAWKRILTLSISLGIIQLINMMYLKADSIIISTIKGTTAVGIYSIAYSLILTFLTLPSFIMTALIPSMATATTESIKPMVEKALEYMAIFACLLAVGGYAVRNDIVPFVSGKSFAAAATPFAILALASAFTYLNSVFGFASVAMNKHHKMIIVSFAALFLNITLNIIVVPRYSVVGAAWSTTISELLALFGVYFIFTKQTGVIVSLKTLLKPAVSAVLTLGIFEVLHSLWSSDVYIINLVIEGIFITSTYFLILASLRGIPPEILQKVKKKLQNISE